MPQIDFQQGVGFFAGHSLDALAQQYGTPLYVYDRQRIASNFNALQAGFGNRSHRICYAVKANSNLMILQTLAQLGAGFDIVSMGELKRVLRAGGKAEKIVFSGVGKSATEIRFALQQQIGCFNIESAEELDEIAAIAKEMHCVAPISLRVNPDVDPKTHPYISTGLSENKFGVPFNQAISLYQKAQQQPSLKIIGIDCHIGSQITEFSPYADAVARLLSLVDQLAAIGIELQHIDVGGGFGVAYDHEPVIPLADWTKQLSALFQERVQTLWIEPGRSIVADAGLLLTRVLRCKENGQLNFAVVDGSMADLLRPALYAAWMKIETVTPSNTPAAIYNVVGPICESSDFLGLHRELALQRGTLLAVGMAGAYGFSMSSNYNSRPRAAELMLDGAQIHVARQRETLEQLWQDETLL